MLYAWTELVPTTVAPSGIAARVVTDGAPCPAVQLVAARRSSLPMRAVTPAPGIVGFSGITACRANIPGGVTSATVGGHRLPLLGHSGPIAVIGDTGCAIEAPDSSGKQKPQDCTTNATWPFPALANGIAAARPQFVLDMGDYIYREASCLTTDPTEQAKCAGSPNVNPSGSPNPDNWAIWQADFFRPAAPMLAAAPLVVTRGNHERCDRAGNGYFLLLDPGTNSPRTCGAIASVNRTRPYVVEANGLRMVILDSAGACDFYAVNRPAYASIFHDASLLAPGSKPRWLITHRPLWGYVKTKSAEETGDNLGACNKAPPPGESWKAVDLEAAASGLKRYAAVLSGHVHAFEAVQIPGRPAQLVLGNGGTELNKGLGKDPTPPGTAPPGSKAPSYANAIDEFGYSLVRKQGTGWILKEFGTDGKRFTTCPFGAAALHCS